MYIFVLFALFNIISGTAAAISSSQNPVPSLNPVDNPITQPVSSLDQINENRRKHRMIEQVKLRYHGMPRSLIQAFC